MAFLVTSITGCLEETKTSTTQSANNLNTEKGEALMEQELEETIQTDTIEQESIPNVEKPKRIVIASKDSKSMTKEEADYVCNGENDHTIIQDAINNINIKGGTVLLTEGTFYLKKNINFVRSNVTLEGSDKDKTILEWSAGCMKISSQNNISLKNFKTVGSGAIHIMNSSNIKVENVIATINKPSPGGAFFITVKEKSIENITFENCIAIDCARHGWQSDGWGSTKLIKNIKYINCEAINCGIDDNRHDSWTCGFILAENCDVENCEVINCYAEGNWESGFHIEGRPNIKNMSICDCISKNNGQKPDDYYNSNIDTYGCLFGSGFWINEEVTLTNCVSENNRKAGYSVWSGSHIPSRSTKFYDCIDTGSEIGFNISETENVHIRNCISNDAGKYGISVLKAQNITTEGLKIKNPGGDGEKCNIFSLSGSPVKDSSFDIDTYGGKDIIVFCLNGRNISFTGTIRSDNKAPVMVSGTGICTEDLIIQN